MVLQFFANLFKTGIDSVSCDVPLGSAHCVKANIYPVPICDSISPTWDKSSISVNGKCVPDSNNNYFVRFVIYNYGTPGDGNMDAPSEYRIYINDSISVINSFQLVGGDSLVINFNSNGNTIRLEADQRPGHPGHSKPRVTIENCGTGTSTPIFGFVTSVPEDDEDKYVEMDCQVVIGSWDPNDKSVKPQGITQNNYVPTKSELEFLINFQNTGTDTAFRVVVTDTLSEFLDVSSLQLGVSSHPYKFKLYEKSILEWTFNNILLPDSNVNEPQSHGFVKFKIKQKPDIAQNTPILNRAAIIFDYNAPVMTNYTNVIALDTTIKHTSFITGTDKTAHRTLNLNISIIPNPTNGSTIFIVPINDKTQKFDIILYDVIGNETRAMMGLNKNVIELSTNGLKPGIYIYKIRSGESILGMGKLMVQE